MDESLGVKIAEAQALLKKVTIDKLDNIFTHKYGVGFYLAKKFHFCYHIRFYSSVRIGYEDFCEHGPVRRRDSRAYKCDFALQRGAGNGVYNNGSGCTDRDGSRI